MDCPKTAFQLNISDQLYPPHTSFYFYDIRNKFSNILSIRSVKQTLAT